MDPACLMAWVSWIPILRLTNGEWVSFAVVVKNQTDCSDHHSLRASRSLHVVAVNTSVPSRRFCTGNALEKLDEMQGVQRVKISAEQRKEAHSSSSWIFLAWGDGSVRNWAATLYPTCWIPWHLFPGIWGVGLYWSGKAWDQELHWWWVLSKKRFSRILPPLVDEVQAHVKEMLEVDYDLAKPEPIVQWLWYWCARRTEVCTF